MSVLRALAARARVDTDLAVAARHVLDVVACIGSGATHPLAGKLRGVVPDGVERDAILAHVDEFDPLHGPSATAPGAVVVPAALHVGASVGASGANVLRAVVAGYEVLVEAGLRFGGPALYAAGWWPTALFGGLGAAAAAAVLLDLDEDSTVHALALAAAPMGGLLSADVLGDAHYLLTGAAAARGVQAAHAAAAGMTGSETLLDGPAARALGRSPGPASPIGPAHLVGTSLKTWPCARPLHTALAAFAALGVVPAPDEVVRIDLPTAALAFVTADRHPPGPAEAAASAAVAVAGAMAGQARDPRWYRAPSRTHPVVLGANPALDAEFPRRWGAEVTVRGMTRRVLVAPGDPDSPLDDAAVRAKAAALLGPSDPRIDALLDLAAQ
jgi:2-methylcitrate dehydratase PrpD